MKINEIIQNIQYTSKTHMSTLHKHIGYILNVYVYVRLKLNVEICSFVGNENHTYSFRLPYTHLQDMEQLFCHL